ncbi:helix-turn-helix transcriptional regulator [Pseudomaricurvus alkylphenolicus]|uniref:helix-turn-helix transcriptional regulator n=1 Tax=Pseudomaricurvus alkylphenolicus TaxID=1306991 RepID=UPI0014205380|nr:AraC family transcriptional regulator [Pseudomaricurvus alkylphenolicus]NIB44882.1 helix-turn-helix transcriptional regulator [Pseudomaricurvus alkylphenolicus]
MKEAKLALEDAFRIDKQDGITVLDPLDSVESQALELADESYSQWLDQLQTWIDAGQLPRAFRLKIGEVGFTDYLVPEHGACLMINRVDAAASFPAVSHKLQGLPYRFHANSTQPLTTIVLLFKPDYLATKLGPQSTPAQARLFAAGEAMDPAAHLISVPMSPAMRMLAGDLLSLPLANPYYPLQAEAKLLELLAIALEAIAADVDLQAHELQYKAGDIRNLESVRERLEQDYANPPGLEELCQSTALNRRKLGEGFKTLYGCTLREYVVVQRMSHAHQLLESGKPPGAVANLVGYADQGSFSKAFKRHYGVLPKDFGRDRNQSVSHR